MIKRKGLGFIDCLVLGFIFVTFVHPCIGIKSVQAKKFALYNYEGKIIRQWQGNFEVDCDSDTFRFTHNGQQNIVRGGIVIIEKTSGDKNAQS